MKEKYFKWLLDSCEPRKGPKLVRGKIHKTGDYPETTVATWVKTKAAAYVKDKPKKEEDE